MKAVRVSRNDLCPCGSGKKFKKCCLSLQTPTPRFSSATVDGYSSAQSCASSVEAGPAERPVFRREAVVEGRRTIVMRMNYPDGRHCDIQLLRNLEWIKRNNVRVHGMVFLDLVDVGVRGWANVVEIKPSEPIEAGEGKLVTGTFCYSHGRIGELVLESEPKPICVTPSHLFWSEDRRHWIPVCQLQPGEVVCTLNGRTRTVSFTLSDRIEPVYNIEVEGDHCYRVGESGVLVHNQSTLPIPESECESESNDIRALHNLTGTVIAYAEWSINGVVGDGFAESGSTSGLGANIPGIPLFTACMVNGRPGEYCAEYKLFEEIGLLCDCKSTGYIKLCVVGASEYCTSCDDVAAQFKARCPNITIISTFVN